MHRYLITPLLIVLAFGCSSNKSKVQKMCLEAKDFNGCMEYMNSLKNGAELNKIKNRQKRKWTRDDGWLVIFDPKSVAAWKVRGEYGRYMKFKYRINGFEGGFTTPSFQQPSTVTTNTYGRFNNSGVFRGGSSSTITPGRIIGGFEIPAGMRSYLFKVEVDCEENTANWVGQLGGWWKLKGPKPTRRDADAVTATEIMDEFCPQMNRLVAEAKEREILNPEPIK